MALGASSRRMQRTEDHGSAKSRLHGDLGGLMIADLADQDDVRRLPEDRPGRCVAKSGRGGISHLGDARQVVLDRVLGRDDLSIGSVQFVKAAYTVVVLPEPGGPVTRRRPFGRLMICRRRW